MSVVSQATEKPDMSNVAVVQVGYNAANPLSTLKLVTKPIPKPSPGQVVVHITLRPINPTDYFSVRGGGNVNGTPGAEGFGIVHEVCTIPPPKTAFHYDLKLQLDGVRVLTC